MATLTTEARGMDTASLIATLPEMLTWSARDAVWDRIHDRYRGVVGEALGDVVAAIDRGGSARGKELIDALDEASDDALLRVVLAPETSYRLLWQRPQDSQATAEFIHRSLLAERAREGRPTAIAEETWTALGDALVKPTGEVVAAPSIEGFVPIDFDSRTVRDADPYGLHHDRSPWHPLVEDHRAIALDRLGQAMACIRATSGVAGDFITRFVKVLVLQEDDEQSYFTGYSTQQYAGRTVIGNPQLAQVGQIAESIVHEAIHAMLYMLLQTHPWGLEDPYFDDTKKLPSPWTGKMLPVSTLLHACFVWYGLLTFWSRATTSKAFPPKWVRGRMSRAALGFAGPPLLERLDEADRDAIAPPIRAAIGRMQDRVIESLGGRGPRNAPSEAVRSGRLYR